MAQLITLPLTVSCFIVKSRLVLPFWYRLTWVVPEKGPLNGCVCVCVGSNCFAATNYESEWCKAAEQTSVAARVGVVGGRAVARVSVPVFAADAAMLARRRRALVRHLRAAGADARHALAAPQRHQLHEVAVVEPQVPQTAAVELGPPARVQRPRQLVPARGSADVERRAEVERAVVAACQVILVLLAVEGEVEAAAVAVDAHVMRPAVVDVAADEEALRGAAQVEQHVEVAVAQFHREEVRPTTSRTGHHHHAVLLDRLEAELDTAAPRRRPLRQAQVRPAPQSITAS